MHIGIVGGLDRNQTRYQSLASDLGHTLECHTGHLEGTGPDALESLVLRSDVVLVQTDVNSHGAVWQARRLAKQHGKRLLFARRMGLSRLRALLAETGGRARSSALAGGASR